MPLYEYQCEACGGRFEMLQKFSDPAPETCSKCGKGPVQRLLSTPAIQFKGSGWYITDYAGGRSSAASSTSASEGDGAGDSKKADKGGTAAPAAKSDGASSSAAAPAAASPAKE